MVGGLFGHDEVVRQFGGLNLLLRSYIPSQKKPIHVHSGRTFFLVLSGGMTERCGSRAFTVGSLEMAVQTAQVEHGTLVSPAGMRALFVEASPTWLAERDLPDNAANSYLVTSDPRVLGVLAIAIELASGSADELTIEQTVTEICASMPPSHEPAEPPWLRTVVEMLQERSDEPLSLASLAREVGIHPVHLARVFRAKQGRSISGYLRGVRVRRALTKAADMPFGSAAVECGFTDQPHFCRSVRRELNRSPKEISAMMRVRETLRSYNS